MLILFSFFPPMEYLIIPGIGVAVVIIALIWDTIRKPIPKYVVTEKEYAHFNDLYFFYIESIGHVLTNAPMTEEKYEAYKKWQAENFKKEDNQQ